MTLNHNIVQNTIRHKELCFELYDTITSTNTVLKQRGRNGAPHGLVLVSTHQTAGRGRMGRQFYSPAETGIYFSLLLRPQLKPEDCLLITTAAAVAVTRVLDRYIDHAAKIKWVNDIYVNNKKVCGILTEAAIHGNGYLDFAVLGIGINITQPHDGFPTELSNIAGSLFFTQKENIRELIMTDVLDTFMDLYETLDSKAHISEYRSRSMLDGMDINVLKSDSIIPAKALNIDEELRLVVQYSDGSIEHLHTGDVSIRRI